ncbi:AAA family ATPase [Amycolatopsis umgeniensis]|uniref:DNA-binding CsgD family transcriptional regulator n=1 Tax=Amycolatopsis umgeniensis TaxID=336628 RepID=A0A841ATE9_9PSEU|nr:LuxR family transcriptional regulator [Amycolatopsis umgeniensis]MBB5850223.1 DNA-binding CsgD family transcriptional regulator [Amycolatopsis umgeniensis]
MPTQPVGRTTEISALEAVIADARKGNGGALVLRGEPGIGKSTLLAQARQDASDFRIVEASGSEFETELPFAALHQLCVPVLGYLGELSPRHREALQVAFGLATGTPDLFRIGLATLDLLSSAARSGPLLCVIDDAHWLDDASTRALTFLARRITSEPVAMIFAVRTPAGGLDELPGLVVEGLSDADARKVLADGVSAVDPRVRDRVVAEARGNPLALLELPKSGGFALPDTASLPNRIERGFAARLAGLPADARLLLTVASADPTGDPGLLWPAARQLGDGVVASADVAEASGLVDFSTRVRFCHPLARSAVYLAAAADDRRRAHQALASVTDPAADPDRRVWHLAQASTGPDDDLAAELARSASRAQARGGVAAAAAFLERAAALSLDAGLRTEHTLGAARAKLDAGAADAAAGLLTTVETGPQDDLTRAKADLLRGRIAFARHTDGNGADFMLRAAHLLAGLDPEWSRECFLDALEVSLVVGRANGVMDKVVDEARSAPPASSPDILDALVLLTAEGHQAAVPVLRRILADRPMWTRRPALATMIAAELWDIETHAEIVGRLMETGRETGSPHTLRLGLAQVASAAVITGDLGKAMSAIAEEEAIADALGVPSLRYPRLHLTAMRGRRAEGLALFDTTAALGIGQLIANVHWTSAVLHNGLADYPAALAAARRATEPGDLFLAGIALPELIEAAVRCGERESAVAALDSLTERTAPSGTSWGLGVTAYARGLVTGAEADYREAVDRLDGSPTTPYRARAHLLFGEWLRREGRRRDAREHLRTAHELLSGMGMEAFARRAADELRATGEVARSRSGPGGEELTLQQVHIARLVATGATSKEVAARLFLSPRTVDAHLRNIFRKLGITSRRQLRDLPDPRIIGSVEG